MQLQTQEPRRLLLSRDAVQGLVGALHSGPAGMAKDALGWWSAQMNAALARGEFIERLNGVAVEGEPNTVEQFNQFVRAQHVVWGARIRDAGIVAE